MSDATMIHCAAAVDVDTRAKLDWTPEAIPQFIETLDKADVLIGHNIMRHDIPLITKLHGWRPRAGVVIRDTMICARVIYPNVKDTDKALVLRGKMPPGKKYAGKHSIAAWGYRLGNPKGDYSVIKEAEWRAVNAQLLKALSEDETKRLVLKYTWGQWSQEMHDYMVQDVDTNLSLWDHLNPDKYSEAALDLEHRIQRVCDQMERAGVPFNVEAAQNLYAELLTKRDQTERRLIDTFGSWYAPISPTKAVFTPKKDNVKLGYTAGAPLTKLKRVQFNPGSRDHIIRVLKERGWRPDPKKMTEGGKPQIDEETVAGVVEQYEELQGLGEYLTVEKRISQIATGSNAWLKMVKEDGHIHGVINPMGTGTSRASHFLPNLAQVPAVKSPYGKECRSLFYAPEGWTQIGADQSGLELRCLAHYLHPLDGGVYAAVVLDGDVHWTNAIAMGLASGERDKHNELHTLIREAGSKRWIYAYIYGCWHKMSGEIIFACVNKARLLSGVAGLDLFNKFFASASPSDQKLKSVGKDAMDGFATSIKGFAKLKSKLAQQLEKYNWLPGLDGRRIPVKSEHSSLNYLIQSCGAIICKRWVADSFEECCRQLRYDYDNPWNGDFVFALWVHDEIQVFARTGLEEKVAAIITEAARRAGDKYSFRVRLDSEAKFGRNWAETH